VFPYSFVFSARKSLPPRGGLQGPTCVWPLHSGDVQCFCPLWARCLYGCAPHHFSDSRSPVSAALVTSLLWTGGACPAAYREQIPGNALYVPLPLAIPSFFFNPIMFVYRPFVVIPLFPSPSPVRWAWPVFLWFLFGKSLVLVVYARAFFDQPSCPSLSDDDAFLWFRWILPSA